MSGQSKIHSFAESFLNILIGYSVAIISQVYIFPLYGINVSLQTNMEIGLIFTLISLVRSYILRRWFNKLTIKKQSRYERQS